ncbi:MAG: Uma2 family endonuclease [Defluviitaleaceae bacterium]|nr:Uma2 family endonuclease [Defluviitaleaceae bacterium]
MSAVVAPKIDTNRLYTYADYAEWPECPRFELINGEAIEMSAPTVDHQAISVALTIQLGTYLRGKKCRLFHAPFDIRLNHKTSDNTVGITCQPP